MNEVFKVTFKRDDDGMIVKDYEGIIKPKDNNDIEMGLSIVIQHIYTHKSAPAQCIGKDCGTGNLLEIIFSKNAFSHYNVDTIATELTTVDLENILTGLVEVLMRLHLERMATEKIKISLKSDKRTSSIDYTPNENLV